MAKRIRPSKPVPKDFAVKLVHQRPKLHYVNDGDSWDTLAKANRMDPITLKHFNFATADRKRLNWYLYNYVGCRKESGDKRHYVFSSKDKNFGTGIIVIPQTQIGSVRSDPPAQKKQKQRGPVIYEKGCDVVGMRCPKPEAVQELIERYKGGTFTGGNAYFNDPIRRGMLFKKRDGDRLVLGAGSMNIVFLMNNRVYVQDAWDFVNDIAYDTFADAGRSAEGMVTLAKIQMALIAGFVSASGAAGFIAVTMTNITKFAVESDVKGLVKKLIALYAAKEVLESLAPTLYDRLFSLSTLWAVVKETGKRLPAAFADITAEDAAQLAGGVLAKLGLKATEKLFKQAFAVAFSLLTFIGTKIVPKAGKIAVEEYSRMANELIDTLRSLDINISNADAQTIIKEITGNQAKIKAELSNLCRDLA